jgi:hypothetical protein
MQRVIDISQPEVDDGRDLLLIASTIGRTLGRIFACRHRRLSWPITRDRRTYRVCSKCGMCRDFDVRTWKTHGPFYQPPNVEVSKRLVL